MGDIETFGKYNLPKFEIHLEPMKEKVVIDGVDVTNGIVSAVVAHESLVHFPVVSLQWRAGAVDLTGVGDVVRDPGVDVLDMLSEIDAEDLEAEALQRAPAGASVTRAALEILKERLSASR